MSGTQRLTDFLVSLDADKLPASTLTNAKWCFLDSLGCGLFGSHQLWSRIIATEMLAEDAKGTSTLFGHVRKLAPPAAALCNGTASHGFELDDLLDHAIVHPGAIIIPAVLAAGEAVNASGERLALGVVAGYEVMDRIGRALGMEPAHKGFHKTTLAGPVGAAVAAGVVMRLSVAQMHAATGLACSAASGIKTFAVGEGGGMMKRMHAGRAAESGVRMAQLASRDFSGPPNAVESRFGLLEIFGGATAGPALMDEDLGSRWAVDNVYVKVYPCCSWIQASVQQAVALRGDTLLAPDAVKRVEIGTNSYARRINNAVRPTDTMGAQYSIPYCIALALTGDPTSPAMYAAEAIEHPGRRALATRVDLVPDPEMEAVYPEHYGSRVRVELMNGEVRESRVLDPHGMPGDPCTEDERRRKFATLAADLYTTERIDRIADVVRNLEQLKTTAELSALLAVA